MLISQGTSRYVYDIGNGLIKKIPKDKYGIWQNESEIRIHNANKDNDVTEEEESNVVSFEVETSDDDGEMTDEETDDLLDMFGF